MVECSPATRAARVRFPADAYFNIEDEVLSTPYNVSLTKTNVPTSKACKRSVNKGIATAGLVKTYGFKHFFFRFLRVFRF